MNIVSRLEVEELENRVMMSASPWSAIIVNHNLQVYQNDILVAVQPATVSVPSDTTVANALQKAGFDASTNAQALQSLFGDNDRAIAVTFQKAVYGATDTATALRTLGDSDRQTATALHGAGFLNTDIVQALQVVYHDSSATATAILNGTPPTAPTPNTLANTITKGLTSLFQWNSQNDSATDATKDAFQQFSAASTPVQNALALFASTIADALTQNAPGGATDAFLTALQHNAVAGVSNATKTAPGDGSVHYTLNFASTLQSQLSLSSLGSAADKLGLQFDAASGSAATATAATTLTLTSITFGVDKNGNFYFNAPQNGINADVNINATLTKAGFRLGFLGATADGSFNLHFAANFGASASASTPGTFALTSQSAAIATYKFGLNVSATLGGVTATGTVNYDSSQSNKVTVNLGSNLGDWTKFTSIDSTRLLNQLNQFASQFQQVADQNWTNQLALTGNKALAQLADLQQAFQNQVLSKLTYLDTSLSEPIPLFTTAQGLNSLLQSIPIASGPLGSLSFDPVHGQLTFTLNSFTDTQTPAPLTLPNLNDGNGLTNVSLSGQLGLTATIGSGLSFGVTLQPSASTLIPASTITLGTTASGTNPDLRIVLTDGTIFNVNLHGNGTTPTVQNVIDAINNTPATTGTGKVTASLDPTSTGLLIKQTTAPQPLTISGQAATLLGLNGSNALGKLQGSSFANLAATTSLSSLNGGKALPNDLTFSLTDGTSIKIDLSKLASNATIQDFISTIGTQTGRISVSVSGSSLLAVEIPKTDFKISAAGSSPAAQSLGLFSRDVSGKPQAGIQDQNKNGLISGDLLNFQTDPGKLSLSTPLSDLSGYATASSGPDLTFSLGDGTTCNVSLQGAKTFGDLVNAITQATDYKVQVSLDTVLGRLVLQQQLTHGIMVLNAPSSTAANALGFAGIVDANRTGSILGTSPTATDLTNHVFLQSAHASVGLSGSATVNGSANLGPVGVSISNGTATLQANAGLSFTGSNTSLNALLNAPNLTSYFSVQNPTGSANLSLPISVGKMSLGAISATWSNITNPSALSVTLPNLATNLQNLLTSAAVNNVIQGLEKARDTINNLPFLNQTLPGLNTTLDDLIQPTATLDQAITALQQNPPQTLNDLVTVLINFKVLAANVTVDQILPSLTGTSLNKSFKFALAYNFDASKTIGLGFKADAGGFAGIYASVPINVSFHVGVNLPIDIDLSGSGGVYIEDSATVQIQAGTNAQNIQFDASVGPFGMFVQGGSVVLGNGTGGRAGWTLSLAADTVDQNHRWALTDVVNHLQQHTVGQLTVTLPMYFPTENDSIGSLALSMTDLSNPLSLQTFYHQKVDGSDNPIIGSPANTLVLPDINALLSNVSLDSLYNSVIGGWDGIIRLLTDDLLKQLNATKIPVVGTQIQHVLDFLQQLDDKVTTQLQNAQQLGAAAIRQVLFDALGANGLGWLVNPTTGKPATVSDTAAQDIAMVGDANTGYDFQFQLHSEPFLISVPLNADLGLSGLGLKLNAGVNLQASFDAALGFGISTQDGFYLDSSDYVKVGFKAQLTGTDPAQAAHLTATLGFFQLDVAAVDPNTPQLSGTVAVALDPATLKALSNNDQTALQNLAKSATHESLGTLTDPSTWHASFQVQANINLNLKATLGGNVNLPNLTAGFYFVIGYDSTQTTQQSPALGFTHVTLDLGNFIDNIANQIQSVLKPIKPIIDMLDTPLPVISDLAGKPFTLLDLASTMGYIDPGTAQFVKDAAQFLNGAVKFEGKFDFGNYALLGNALDSGSQGNLTYTNTPASPQSLAAGTQSPTAQNNPIQSVTGFQIPILKDPSLVFQLLMGKDISLVTYTMPDLKFDLSYSQFFPIIGPLGASLKGEITATAHFAFGFDTSGFRQFVASDYQDPALILDGLYIDDSSNFTLGGSISAYASLNLGLIEAGVGGGLGVSATFTINDPNNDGKVHADELWNDIQTGNIFKVQGTLYAFLAAYVKPFIGPELDFNIAHVTLASISQSAQTSDTTPQLASDNNAATPVVKQAATASVATYAVPGGTLRLNIGAYASDRVYGDTTTSSGETVSVTPGPTANSVYVTEFGQKNLYTGVSKIVASTGGGSNNITIVAGSNITIDAGPNIDVDLTGSTDSTGNTFLIKSAHNVTIQAGDGGDTITVVNATGTVNITGGAGSDTIEVDAASSANLTGGSGAGVSLIVKGTTPAVLRAGSGSDTLDASADTANNVVGIGGNGNDTLKGGNGAGDLLFADGAQQQPNGSWTPISGFNSSKQDSLMAGNGSGQILFGGAGNDTLIAGIGDRQILHGGPGNDLLQGGSGQNQQLLGEGGNDTLMAGSGDFQSLDGGAGNDILVGGTGQNQQLQGGFGDDQLFGGTGPNQVLHGGADNDQLYGGNGPNQTLYGDAGADWLQVGWHYDANGRPVGYDPTSSTDLGAQGIRIGLTGTLTAQNTIIGLDLTQLRTGMQVAGPGIPSGTTITVQGNGQISLTLPANTTLPTSALGKIPLTFTYGYTMHGGDGNDTLYGGAGNDTLDGEGDADQLHGGEGDDVLDGGDGNDILFGDGGNDTLSGGAGTNYLFGDYGGDASVGIALQSAGITAPDLVPSDGAPGNDTFITGPGTDNMYGEQGDDTFLLRLAGGSSIIANDIFSGGPGKDSIIFQGGNLDAQGNPINDDINVSMVDASTSTYSISDKYVVWNYDQNGNIVSPKQVIQDLGNLQFKMSNDVEVFQVSGMAGDDRMRVDAAFNQRVVLDGGAGNDLLVAGSGDETLMGGAGNDVLVAGSGIDILHGGTGTADPKVDAGNDILIGGSSNNDVLLGEGGLMNTDVLIGGGNTGFLYGGWGNNVIFGDHFHDLVNVLPGGAAGYQLSADMIATLQKARAIAGQTRTDSKGNQTPYDAINTDSASGVVIYGHPDTESTVGGNNVILGSAGDDVILSGAGNNYVDGRAGMDVLLGGQGSPLSLTGNINAGANPTLTGIDASQLTPGMQVAGPGIPAGTTITVNNGQIHLMLLPNTSVSDSATGVSLTFTTGDILIGGGGFDRIIAGTKDSYLYSTEPSDPANSLEQNALGGGPTTLQNMRAAEQTDIDKFVALDDQVVHEETDRAALNALFSQFGQIQKNSSMWVDTSPNSDGAKAISNAEMLHPEQATTQALYNYLTGLYGSDPVANYTQWQNLLPKDDQYLRSLEKDVNEADTIVQNEYNQFVPQLGGASNVNINNTKASTPFYVLLGGTGNDTFFGSPDEDVIAGGTGNNTINWSPGQDVIFGGDPTKINALVVSGTQYNDKITVDAISHTANFVSIQFTDAAGNKHTTPDSDPQNYPGKGIRTDFPGINTVRVDALGGDDTVTFTEAAKSDGSLNYVIDGGAGNDNLDASGTQSDSVVLIGGAGNDILKAGSGADVLLGSDAQLQPDGKTYLPLTVTGPDNDILYAGPGIGQKLYGGGGDDQLFGYGSSQNPDTTANPNSSHGANASLNGGDGNDLLYAGEGSGVTLIGGAGNDILQGGSGPNQQLTAGTGPTTLIAGSGINQILQGGRGNTVFALDVNATGTPILRGMPGANNTLVYRAQANDWVTVFQKAIDDQPSAITYNGAPLIKNTWITYDASAGNISQYEVEPDGLNATTQNVIARGASSNIPSTGNASVDFYFNFVATSFGHTYGYLLNTTPYGFLQPLPVPVVAPLTIIANAPFSYYFLLGWYDIAEATSPTGAVVNFFPTASSVLDSAPSVTTSLPSGTVFKLGETPLTVTATDRLGHTLTLQLDVIVRDTTAPTLQNLPANLPAAVVGWWGGNVAVLREATSAAGAPITFPMPTATDAVDPHPVVHITYQGASGQQVPFVMGQTLGLGYTILTVTATDFSGNTSSSTIGVFVHDTTPPTLLNVPKNITVAANNLLGATVNFVMPTATDLVDPHPSVTVSQASGTNFPVGTTTVTVLTADASGNLKTATFTVTVTPAATSQWVVTTQPGNSVAGSLFRLVVAAEDAFGNVTPSFNGPVSIALGNNPGGLGGVLGGTLTQQAVNGIATFANLTLYQAANGYTIKVLGSAGLSGATTAPFNITTLNFATGFASASGQLTLNGSAVFNGTKAELTNANTGGVSSLFSPTPVNITQFHTQFQFQLSPGANTADGFTFTIQGNGPNALGGGGGGLGYAGVGNSIAVKFDLFSNSGEGTNSTGLYINGAVPTNAGSVDLTPSGLDLHSGHVFTANLVYDGTTLTVTLTDTVTGKSATQKYALPNLSSIVGASAYVGFTAGTGGLTSTQDILNWVFTQGTTK